MEVGMDDRRLNRYVLALSWRLQCVGCPYRETQLLCRRFRELPIDTRVKVWDMKTSELPEVQYAVWHLKTGDEEDDQEEIEDER